MQNVWYPYPPPTPRNQPEEPSSTNHISLGNLMSWEFPYFFAPAFCAALVTLPAPLSVLATLLMTPTATV